MMVSSRLAFPSKKECNKCHKIFLAKAEFCWNCGTSHPPHHERKRTLCEEDLSSDDEVCSVFEKSWMNASETGSDGHHTLGTSATDPESPSAKSKNSASMSEEAQVAEITASASPFMEQIYVEFKVVIGPEFKYDPSRDAVGIKFSAEELGGWDGPIKYYLSNERELGEGYYLLSGIVTISKRLLIQGGTEYRYIVRFATILKWETILKDCGNEIDHGNRQLSIKYGYEKDTFCTYDIIIFPAPKAFLHRKQVGLSPPAIFLPRMSFSLETYYHQDSYNQITKARWIGALAMFPLWPTHSQRSADGFQTLGAGFLVQIVGALQGMERIILDEKFCETDCDQIQQIFEHFLWNGLAILKETNQGPDLITAEIRFIIGLAAVHITRAHTRLLGGILEHFDDVLKLICDGLLLPTMNSGPDCAAFETVIRRHLAGHERELLQDVIEFMKIVMERKLYQWIQVVPVLHILGGNSKLCEVKPFDRNHNNRRDVNWWGIQQIWKELEHFKENTDSGIPLGSVLERVECLFQVDYLLQRTILATLKKSELLCVVDFGCFEPDSCLALVFHHLNSGDCDDPALRFAILKILEYVQNQLAARESKWAQASIGERDTLLQETLFCCIICHDILNLTTKDLKFTSGCHRFIYINAFAQTHSSSIGLLWKFLEGQHGGDLKQEAINLQKKFIHGLFHWLDQTIPGTMLASDANMVINDKSELQAWSCLFGISWPEKEIHSNYMAVLRQRLKKRLTQLHPPDDKLNELQDLHVIELHVSACQYYSQLNPVVEEVLIGTTFEAVERMVSSGTFFAAWKPRDLTHLIPLIEKLFWKYWPKNANWEDGLKHMLLWPPMTNYITIFLNEKSSLFGEQCSSCIREFILFIHQIVHVVVGGGKVRAGYFRIVCENEKGFLDISELLINLRPNFGDMNSFGVKQAKPGHVLRKLLVLRQEEMEEFIKVHSRVNILLATCKAINPVDTGRLERKASEAVGHLFFNRMCNPLNPGMSKGTKAPKIMYFELPDSVYEILPRLQNYHELELFREFWKRTAERRRRGQRDKVLTLEEVVKHVWNPCVSTCQDICRSIRDGTITLERVASLSLLKTFKSFQRLMEVIAREAHTLDDTGTFDLSLTDLRLKQFQQYELMQLNKVRAETIQTIQKVYGLTGDFSYIDLVLESVNIPRLSLGAIEDNPVAIGQELEKIYHSQLEGMRSFIKARELIIWLRENLKGIQEVKVLVDLAMIRAAGQGDVEVNRVSCLHLAVTGFAPLIYSIKTSAGFKGLMWCLKEVSRVLESDLSLPSRLDEVSANLQWLQEVHNAHGDVEKNALELATNINARGVFQVGRLEAEVFGKVTLENAVSLEIEMENGQQLLGLNELNDLQSKLMLIAGKAQKGGDEVDRFCQMFDGIITLASTYVKICEAGNILFKDWKASFYCSNTSEVCVQMDFIHDLVNGKLNGRPTRGLDVVQHLDEICSFMENCLDDWLDYIQQKRNQYMELNYFTMSQLVLMRSNLAKLKETKTLDAKTFHVLHIVMEDCSEEDLLSALESASMELQAQDKEMPHPSTNDKEETGVLSGEVQFIHDRSVEDFPDKLSVKGREKFSPQSFEDGIPSDKTWTWVQENLLREAEERSDSEGTYSLKPVLDGVWKGFMSSSTRSVSDYLSVEHLGLLVKHLRLLGKHDLNRTAPKHLVKGKPNLVVCPARHIVNVVLSIYYQDEEKPLPKRDEVLYCTEDTTHEEVDLLWRRALSDKTGRIFSVLFVEQLSYDVSEMAVRGLEKLMKHSNDYYLVIVSASEGETKSQLVTAFENCRIGVPNVMPDQINRYLKNKFEIVENDSEWSTVRLVRSDRSGMGKSLYVTRLAEKLSSKEKSALVTLPLHQRKIDVTKVLNMLLKHVTKPGRLLPRIYHFDIAYEVLEGVDYLLFNLLILGSVCDQEGNVWRRSPFDLYVIEALPRLTSNEQAENNFQHVVMSFLPSSMCRTPTESLDILKGKTANADTNLDQLMDERTVRSEPYQRVFQYLRCFDRGTPMEDVNPAEVNVTMEECLECLETLIGHFGVQNPTWAELQHFVAFLDKQLRDCERYLFAFAKLPEFRRFLVQFMLQMSNDFATRSVMVSEETRVPRPREETVDQYQLRRKWEESPHPCLFLNENTMTMTTLGFDISIINGNIINPRTGQVVMTKQLYDALLMNGVNLKEKFDDLPRRLKIEKLCKVMGVPDREIGDPDTTYELTTDNVKKMLAIQMRFRCGIPVVLMGETGSGKTRLIQFMCALQVRPGSRIRNLIKLKTHGGTTEEDIRKKVVEACNVAESNMRVIRTIRGPNAHIQTVLFFDEANTTEAIGLIKEIMVDKRMDGQPLNLNNGLKIIAACNPYRRHSPEMVKKLEHAGLGYYVNADATKEKLGEIPMRQLVYRVQALPQSMLPLVWDFGQLDTNTEKLYIKQIVKRFMKEEETIGQNEELFDVISSVLAASQQFIRQNKDECIFVSLRDVERVMKVMMWFYKLRTLLFKKMDDLLRQQKDEYFESDTESHDSDEEAERLADSADKDDWIDPIVRSLTLALGVCYVASLENRNKYCEYVAGYFTEPCELEEGAQTIQEQIECCQDVFLKEVQVEDDIARNLALKENVFMMVVCIELRIPLFLVGKPGSSKSLAKTIVDNALEGRAAKSDLFRHFKQVHMISCQCSRLSTADVIVRTFQQCAELQENKKDHLNEFVSVVVLDEVGLAEDSPRMPLKTLHPLLEDGCIGDEAPEEFKKVAFIGISNWALDPAKTNRGILLQRGAPEENELYYTAKGICDRSEKGRAALDYLLQPLTIAYWKIYETGSKYGSVRSEFFGLRDFYSLVKMLLQLCDNSEYASLSWKKLMYAVWRNFDGLENLGDEDNESPIKIFEQHLEVYMDKSIGHDDDPQSSSLLSDGLSGDGRYLLILTEKDTPLDLLQQLLPNAENAIVIYGSSFPRDQEYTQVCRNINAVKMCMETGRTVILHDLENLYESLYDALNQCYVTMGPNRFVDLGLGTQRVKCLVHKDFRLVLIAEKETVYRKFSIPLINRLEKHFMHVSSMLGPHQMELVERLQRWSLTLARRSQKSCAADVLVGYHVDAAASVVLQVTRPIGPEFINRLTPDMWSEIEQKCREVLLQSADPGVLMRLPDVNFNARSQESFAEYLYECLIRNKPQQAKFCQITTYSKLISGSERDKIAGQLGWDSATVYLKSLQAFNTEQQFSNLLRNLFLLKKPWDRVLILQCDSGNEHNQLLACARHIIINIFRQCQEELQESEGKIGKTHVALVVQLPRRKGGCFVSFQAGKWLSAHIDDLRLCPHRILIQQLKQKSIRELVEDAVKQDNASTEHVVPEGGELCLQHLLFSCCCKAATMLRDINHQRTLERIHTVKQHFPEPELVTEYSDFAAIIQKRLLDLLQEKELRAGGVDQARKWLNGALQSVIEVGTFRRAWMSYIEKQVSPLLAGLLKYVDTNNNMSILEKAPPEHWLHRLWLRMLSSPAATTLEFKDLLSEEKLPEEFMVRMTACGGKEMSGRLPFSWVIKDILDNLLEQTNRMPGGPESDLDDLFHKTEMGKCLKEAYEEVGQATVVDLYINDYVRMVYRVVTEYNEDEYLIVKKMILSYCTNEMKKNRKENEFLVLKLSDIQTTFAKIQKRVHNCSQLLSVFPEGIGKFQEFLDDPRMQRNVLVDTTEMTQDLILMDVCIRDLEPNTEVTEDPGRRKDWLSKVEQRMPLLGRMTEHLQQSAGEIGPDCQNYHNALRCKKDRVQAVYLFYKHVQPPHIRDEMTSEKIPVWLLWRPKCDFRKMDTMMKIREIIKFSNERASLVYPRRSIHAHNRYKQRCIIFFTELMAQLVFVGHHQVEGAVVEMLLRYVTQESSLLAESPERRVITQTIEPTPAVRSILLNLLLRARYDEVKRYMTLFFKRAKRFQGDNDEQLLQLCLLFVHSFQGAFYDRVPLGSENEIEQVRGLFEVSEKRMDEPALSIATIEAVGMLRFCLDKLSGYLDQAYMKEDLPKDRLDHMLAIAERVCSHRGSGNIQWYLLRQLVRQSGLEYVLNMMKNNDSLAWILPPTITIKDFCKPHTFSIYGDFFVNLQVGIRQVHHSNDNCTLVTTYQAIPEEQRKTCLLMALYVEVTLSASDGTLDFHKLQNSALPESLVQCQTDPNSAMVRGLLTNQLGLNGMQLIVQPNQDVTEQSLAALIVHFIFVLTNVSDNCLTKPFKDMIEKPTALKDVLLPAMPQDDSVEMYEAVAEDLKQLWDLNGQFGVYRCPNNHMFVVNGCGRVTEHQSFCPTCKEPIGGHGEGRPLEGVTNVRPDEIRDTTEKGHCLGRAQLRKRNPLPERKLNRMTTAVMRFFVHIALYAGANHSPQEVAELITPRSEGSVNEFLWDHIIFDLDLLTRCINCSRDDVLLLMHILLKSITSTGGNTSQFSLLDKPSRELWEEVFANTYLNPVLNNYTEELQQATALLSGENKLLKKLYDQENVVNNEADSSFAEDGTKLDFADIFSFESLWRHKARISLEDVANKLDEYRSKHKEELRQAQPERSNEEGGAGPDNAASDDCDILYKFLDKRKLLSAMRYLPNITRLVNELVRENHRALSYNQANHLTLNRFLKNVSDRMQREMYSSFIDEFAAAWEIVRPFLPSHVFGGLRVPSELTSEPIQKDKTVIATLLPATQGPGLCAEGLIHFLAELQNEFLRTMPGMKNLENSVVCTEEVLPSHLIYFNPEEDLLPIFLAHCDYSLELRKPLKISYNFPALQTHLEDRLLRGIPLIEIKVPHMLYQEDLTNVTKLENLNDNIPQEYFSASVVSQIQGELGHHLPDITECLVMLDTALGFLMSFRNQSPHTLLIQFLSETLGLNTSYFPPKAHQACELCHVKALWLLLSHEHAKILSRTAQDPFERVQNMYTEELADDEKAALYTLLPHLNPDLFLAELHECILMQITKPEKTTADAPTANWEHRLRDVLYEYVSSKDEPPDIPVIQEMLFPDTILVSKCVSVWKYIFQRSIPTR